jgi:hypothetical protein
MKKMPIKCDMDWEAYQDILAASQDKPVKLFATKVEVDRLHIDLNQCPSPHDAMTPTRNVAHDDLVEMNDMSQPPFSEQMDVEMNVSEHKDYVNAEHIFGFGMDDEDMEDDASKWENEYHDNYIGDVEAQVEQDGMDHDIIYRRSCAIDTEMGSRRGRPKPS